MTKTRTLTATEARSYVTHCPVCPDPKDTQVEQKFYDYGMEAEGTEMWQRFRCYDCDTTWTEVFLLYLIEVGEPRRQTEMHQ